MNSLFGPIKHKNKKGQAAVEFLSTYGWALIVVLGVIGLMNYYGVFDLGRYFPDIIDFPEEIEVFDHLFSGDTGEFRINLINRMGFSFHVMDAALISPDTPVTLICDNQTAINFFWNESESAEFVFNCNFNEVGFDSGAKAHLLFNLTYVAAGSDSTYIHSSIGDINAVME